MFRSVPVHLVWFAPFAASQIKVKWISHFAEGSAINHSVLGIASLYYPDRASPKPAQPSIRSSEDLNDLTHGVAQLPTCSLKPQNLGVNSTSDRASRVFHYSVRSTWSPFPWAKPPSLPSLTPPSADPDRNVSSQANTAIPGFRWVDHIPYRVSTCNGQSPS